MKSINKLITIVSLALTVLTVGLLADNQATIGANWASEYEFRGRQVSSNTAQVYVETQWNNINFDISSYWNIEDKDRTVSHKIEVDLGYQFQDVVVDKVNLTVGSNAYWYPEANTSFAETKYTIEPYVELSYDWFLNPTLGAYYDIQLEQYTFIVGISEEFVSDSIPEFSITPYLYYGYTDSRDTLPELASKIRNGYGYFSAKIRANYELTDAIDVYVTGQYFVNRDIGKTDDHIYWSIGTEYQF